MILTVRDLNVELDRRSIIEHLSFSVKRGDIVTILGPNGAGKTVLLKCLLGLLPYRGEIRWARDIKIGYVPQRLPFIKDIPLSVMDFFALKRVSGQDAREIVQRTGGLQSRPVFLRPKDRRAVLRAVPEDTDCLGPDRRPSGVALRRANHRHRHRRRGDHLQTSYSQLQGRAST